MMEISKIEQKALEIIKANPEAAKKVINRHNFDLFKAALKKMVSESKLDPQYVTDISSIVLEALEVDILSDEWLKNALQMSENIVKIIARYKKVDGDSQREEREYKDG